MAHFIFSESSLLQHITALHASSLETKDLLFSRLGVHVQPHAVVTILVISRDEYAGYDAIFTLAIECEALYGKRIDPSKVRFVVLKDFEAASKSPHLERARFIIIPDENLLDASLYPELRRILPFVH